MQTNELRIGNYVYHNGKRITVVNIAKKSINLTFDKEHKVTSWINADDIQPIELSTDIIKRLGFRDFYTTFRWKDSNYRVVRTRDSYYISFIHDHSKLTPIKYVHELQNAIFALTGDMVNFRR